MIFIVFFETVLGRKHSGKVSKKFIGKFYFWGITLNFTEQEIILLGSYSLKNWYILQKQDLEEQQKEKKIGGDFSVWMKI